MAEKWENILDLQSLAARFASKCWIFQGVPQMAMKKFLVRSSVSIEESQALSSAESGEPAQQSGRCNHASGTKSNEKEEHGRTGTQKHNAESQQLECKVLLSILPKGSTEAQERRSSCLSQKRKTNPQTFKSVISR